MKEPKKQNKTLNFKIVHASQQAVKHIILSNSHPLILFSNLSAVWFIYKMVSSSRRFKSGQSSSPKLWQLLNLNCSRHSKHLANFKY